MGEGSQRGRGWRASGRGDWGGGGQEGRFGGGGLHGPKAKCWLITSSANLPLPSL